MGNRRIGRKRLYAVEKAGKKIDLESGAGIKDVVVAASQHRNGQELITEIAIDLGCTAALAAPIKSATHDRDPIGIAPGDGGGAAFLTQLTEAKYGVITEVRMICLEDAASLTNLDLEFGTNGDGVNDTADTGSPTSILTAIGNAIGEDSAQQYSARELQNKYLYICNGAGDTPDAFTKGKFLIYLHGFEEPADT